LIGPKSPESEGKEAQAAGLGVHASRDGDSDGTRTTAARGQGPACPQANGKADWSPKSLTQAIRRSGLDVSIAEVVA